MIKWFLKKLESSSNRNVVKSLAEAFFSIAHLALGILPSRNRCPSCNARLIIIYRPVVGAELIREANLDSTWVEYFNKREGGICISCGASLRVRQLSLALSNYLQEKTGKKEMDLQSLIQLEEVQKMAVAEINSCGALHKVLKRIHSLAYSEFAPDSKNIRHEDLLSLSYKNEVFDLVLHSDTIEHIPDLDRAFSELWRVLKSGGAMIFSAPVVRDGRESLVRACLKNGKIEKLLPPSYHGGSYQTTRQYLVCYEFGDDLAEKIRGYGFDLEIVEHPTNPAALTFIATKPLNS